MSYESIAELLQKLKNELASNELDKESLKLLESFDADVHSLIENAKQQETQPELLPESETLTDTAKRLETHFAAEHPVAETALREIVNALARMGI